jgi:hypothetical protein
LVYWFSLTGKLAVALKDLIASNATLTEEAVEAIVKDYVRYDPDEREIALTAAGAALPAKAKILVYLVALQGWPFVSQDTVATDASPGEINEHLGIPGGTVRPMLMDLTDRHLLSNKNGRYSVRAASLGGVKAEITQSGPARSASRRPTKSPKEATAKEPTEVSTAKSAQLRKSKPKNGNKSSVAGRFEDLIDTGFFDDTKTLVDVGKKLHQAGIIISRTSIPYYLLKAVRGDRLLREEIQVAGKNVWGYRRPK